MGDDFISYLPDYALTPAQLKRLPIRRRLNPSHGFFGEVIEEFPPPASDGPSMTDLEWQRFCNPEPRPPIVGYDGCNIPGAKRWNGTEYVDCITTEEIMEIEAIYTMVAANEGE